MALIDSLLQFFSTYSIELKNKRSFLVACSGGPDSVALAVALKSLEDRLPFQFRLAHVNHQLRGADSKKDAQFVQDLAVRLGWSYHSKIEPVSAFRGNLEEQARVKRYNALLKIAKKGKCSGILTAHNLDDQTETILMNMLRGVGPVGLGGMSAFRIFPGSSVYLGRPLLGTSKKEIKSFLKLRRVMYRIDRSNTNENFLRNWLRRKIVPLLEARAPGFKERVGHLATLVSGEQEFWDDYLNTVEGDVFLKGRVDRVLDLKRLLRYPPAVQRRFLRRVIGKDLLTFDAVEGLRRWMQAPPSSGRVWQMKKGWIAERLSKTKGSPSAVFFIIKQAVIPASCY